jgi:hypothetical protein
MSQITLAVCKKLGRDFRVAGSYETQREAEMVGDALLGAKACVGYRLTTVLAEKFSTPAPQPVAAQPAPAGEPA